MALNQKPKPKSTKLGSVKSQGFDFETFVPQKFHIPIVFAVVMVLYLIFLAPMYFGGKVFQSGDIMASQSMQPYLQKAHEGFTLWNPHIFLGMPAYSLSVGYTWFNLIYVVITFFRDIFTGIFGVDYAKWSFYLIILSMTAYSFMKQLTKNTMASLFTAIATGFSTGLIVFLFIGHVTKLTSICMYPLIFLILFRFQKKVKLLDVILLTIAAQLFVQGFHVQIIFYTLFSIGIYFLYFFSYAFITGNKALNLNLVKSVFALVFAIGVGLAIQLDNFSQIYEYTPYSTRGGKSIVENATGKSTEDKSSSDYYKYHTDWSFSPEEISTFIVPSYYGFGYIPVKAQGQEVRLNTYFGQMPFVDVAMYMGVGVFFLALYGVYARRKEPAVQFFALLSVIALVISFGRNLPFAFDLMFKFFPYFDKFRVPSMILVLVQLSIPVLAGFGVARIIELGKEYEEKEKNVLRILAGLAGLFLLVTVAFNSTLTDSFRTRMASNEKMAQQIAGYKQYGIDLVDEAAKVFSADLMVAGLIVGIIFGLAYFVSLKKIPGFVFAVAVILLTVFDLFRIDGRGAEFVQNPDTSNMFAQPEYIKAIKAQKDTEPFRMLNLKQDNTPGSISQNSNYNAYFLVEDFYGYSAIKPRGYQDLMDVVGPGNPTLWNISNVKYIVLDKPVAFPGFTTIAQDANYVVYRNEGALRRADFVDSVATKPNLDVLNMIKENKFNAKRVAYIHEGTINADKPDSTASIKVAKYTDEKLYLDVHASGNNFLVFSTTYMPVGWHATIDGATTEIKRVNHNFMGVLVPKGNHEVKFEYAPKSFAVAKNVSLSLSAVVLVALIGAVGFEFRKKKAENSDEKQV